MSTFKNRIAPLIAAMALFIGTCTYMATTQVAYAITCQGYANIVNDYLPHESNALLVEFEMATYYDHCVDTFHHYDILKYTTLKVRSTGEMYCGPIDEFVINPGVLDGVSPTSASWRCQPGVRLYSFKWYWGQKTLNGGADDRCMGFHWEANADGFLNDDADGQSPTGCIG